MIRIGVSSCLVGENVRYDGGHRRDAVVTECLARHCELIPICPELELGLGVPRPAIQLVRVEAKLRLRRVDDGLELTGDMDAYAERRLDDLASNSLDGFVLKSRSPSCGPGDAPVHNARGNVEGHGWGRFAHALRERFPDLPIVSEDDLGDEKAGLRFLAAAGIHSLERSGLYTHDVCELSRRLGSLLSVDTESLETIVRELTL